MFNKKSRYSCNCLRVVSSVVDESPTLSLKIGQQTLERFGRFIELLVPVPTLITLSPHELFDTGCHVAYMPSLFRSHLEYGVLNHSHSYSRKPSALLNYFNELNIVGSYFVVSFHFLFGVLQNDRLIIFLLCFLSILHRFCIQINIFEFYFP